MLNEAVIPTTQTTVRRRPKSRAPAPSVLVAGARISTRLTVVWVVGITASFSILDHMDGLCAGVAAMASVSFAMLAYLNGQTLVTTLAAAVLARPAGFCAGF